MLWIYLTYPKTMQNMIINQVQNILEQKRLPWWKILNKFRILFKLLIHFSKISVKYDLGIILVTQN